jgi:Fe-S-cluster containining protein
MESDSADDASCERLFTCTRCGDCCKGFGGTYLSSVDITSIADYLGITTEQFVTGYTTMSGNRHLIRQGGNGYCVFWDQVCTIHPVKPKMCRQWPYIRSILVDVVNWRAMAASCPGMNAEASDAEILACVQKKVTDDDGY